MLSPELLRDTLEYAPDAILICDSSGSVVFANRRTRELFLYETQELVGVGIEQLLPGFRKPFARRKDGSEFPVEVRLAPVEGSPEHQAFVVALKPQARDFAVTPLLEALHGEFVGVAARKRLLFRLACSVSIIHTDPALLEQILRNLISNAIKYTREGSVLLRCHQEGATATIEVVDTGICEELFRVGGTARNVDDGYGLGLTIVSRLVKLLELKLEVRSEPGKGSQFRLQVPLGQSGRTG